MLSSADQDSLVEASTRYAAHDAKRKAESNDRAIVALSEVIATLEQRIRVLEAKLAAK